jgi:Serine/threonine protein kinase
MEYHKKHIMACNNEDVANKWVAYLNQGVAYATYIEEKMKKELQSVDGASSLVSSFIETPTEELELEDPVRGNLFYSVQEPAKVEKEKPPNKNFFKTTDNLDTRPSSGNTSTASTFSNGSKGKGSPKSEERKESPKTSGSDTSEEMREKMKDEADLSKLMDEKVNFSSFQVLKVLGSGAFGKVYKVKKKDDGKIYAMKALKKRNLILKNQLRYAITECNVLKTTQHPFVLGLHYAFQVP